MKTKIYQSASVISVVIFALLIVSCDSNTADKPPESADGEYYETIPVIDAYYQGQEVWFLHTDVTSKEMAERLTKMVKYPTNFAPQLQEAVNLDKISKIYVFKNGVDQSEAEPWGGGPFHFQIDILNAVPGDSSYTPLMNPHLVSWKQEENARILKSEEELLEAEKNGELTINKTDVVVNAPVVRWPGKK